METFKVSTFWTTENVSITSEHRTLRSTTEKSKSELTLVTVCIVIKAASPPEITGIIISLSGSNCTEVRRQGRGQGTVSAVLVPEHKPVNEGHQILVSLEPPASVMLVAVNLVSRVSGGGGDTREALGAGKPVDNRIEADTRGSPPLRPPRHNERRRHHFLDTVDVQLTRWRHRELRQRRPAPTKTGTGYWFSISRLQLPAGAGRHEGHLISKLDSAELTRNGTENLAGTDQLVLNQFLHRQPDVPNQAGWPKSSRTMSLEKISKGETKERYKRPVKGARLSRR